MKRTPFSQPCHGCGKSFRSDFLSIDPGDRERLLCDDCLEKAEAEYAETERKNKQAKESAK